MKYILFFILLFFVSSVYSQNLEIKTAKDRSDENLDNLPFTVGFEYGFFLPFKNSNYTSSYYGSFGYYLNEKKNASIEIIIGKLIPPKAQNVSSRNSVGLGLTWRFLKIDKSRFLVNFGLAFMPSASDPPSHGGLGVPGGFNLGVTYLYNIKHIVNISASLKYPFIGTSSGYDGNNYYPVFSLGLLLFPR